MKPEMKAKMKQILDDVLKQSGNPKATEQIPKFPIDRVKTGKDQHYDLHYTRYYARYNDRLFTDIVKLIYIYIYIYNDRHFDRQSSNG